MRQHRARLRPGPNSAEGSPVTPNANPANAREPGRCRPCRHLPAACPHPRPTGVAGVCDAREPISGRSRRRRPSCRGVLGAWRPAPRRAPDPPVPARRAVRGARHPPIVGTCWWKCHTSWSPTGSSRRVVAINGRVRRPPAARDEGRRGGVVRSTPGTTRRPRVDPATVLWPTHGPRGPAAAHRSPGAPTTARDQGLAGERVTGIEPAFSAWEADVLPLNYTREVRP